MYIPDLLLKVEDIQNHKPNTMMEVITQFMPLIKKYSNLLRFEDAEQELIVSFIEILYAIPIRTIQEKEGSTYIALLSYIKVAVHNRYIELSKRHQRLQDNEWFLPEGDEIDRYIWFDTVEDNDLSIIMRDALQKLNQKQRIILVERYICGYSDAEISERLGISRQAVNRSRHRALEKLRLQLSTHAPDEKLY